MTEPSDLYQQVILEHNRKPQNFRKIEDPTFKSEGYNPLCGDHLWLYVKIMDGVITDLSFEGSGCAISKASASMMTSFLKGKKVHEAQDLIKNFRELLIGHPHEIEKLGKLKIFSNIWKYPARVKCASLAWHTVSGAFSEQEKVTTEE